jgi:VWFA-related protein
MRSGPRILVSLWLGLAAVTTAQDRPASDPQQPTFRTGIQSVRVDLYVTRDGEPVRDLRRDEVQVFEDGVVQNVDTFERIVFAEPGSRPAVEPRTAPERRQLATDHRARLFVVFLTAPEPRLTVAQRQAAPSRQTQSQVLEMLNGLLGPDDVVAVMTPYMRIEDLIFQRQVPREDEAWFRDLNKDPKFARWDACFRPGGGSPNGEMKARYRELVTFQALEGLVTHLSGLRDERKHILVMTDGFRLYTKNPRLPARGQPESGGFPIGGGGGIGIVPRLGDSGGVSGARIPSDCEQDLRDLASLDHASRLDQIATYARRTNVSFYPISLLRTASDPTRNLRLRGSFENNSTVLMQSSLRDLAEETDGLSIVNTNNVNAILRRIVTTTSSYYLVGYTPANATADGRFRRITVKVSRPDTNVSARAGYVAGLPAPAVAVPVETRKPPDPVDVSMRALNVSSTSALHVRPAVWTRGAAPGARTTSVWIDAELDPQLRRQRLQAEGGTVEMILRPIRGGDPISRQLPVTTATNFEFELRGLDALAPGEYSIQLQLTGAGGAPVGEFLRVVVPESTSSLGEALLLRRGPTTGPRYARTADPRFYRTDRLRLELPTDSTEPATGQLRDRRGGALATPVQIIGREDESGQFRWIVADVPLTSIAPGDYVVEVTQGSATRLTAFRVVP